MFSYVQMIMIFMKSQMRQSLNCDIQKNHDRQIRDKC